MPKLLIAMAAGPCAVGRHQSSGGQPEHPKPYLIVLNFFTQEFLNRLRPSPVKID
jgi:hypothetical protein